MIHEIFKAGEGKVKEVYVIEGKHISKYVKEELVYTRGVTYLISEAGACSCPAMVNYAVKQCKHLKMFQGVLTGKSVSPAVLAEFLQNLFGNSFGLEDYLSSISNVKLSRELPVDCIVFEVNWKNLASSVWVYIYGKNTKVPVAEEIFG